ncbi:MAG: 50S ribosomal protein L13 [Aquificota bacterium]|nr:MAG: 50S ribosomal protein L13 [Aquificota bacterium]
MRTPKTYMAKPGEVERRWYVVDAKDKVVGRLASRIAMILMGKHKPHYTPHVDTGDFVVVINASRVRFTGRKWEQKCYYRHSGYPGGLKVRRAKDLLEKRPEEILRHAVKGMLPKNNLGRRLLRKLKIYPGETHPHEAQKPVKLEL